MRIKTTSQRGFTLVEMLVSVALFSVVMLVATASLLAMVDANRKAQAIKSVMDNMNAAIENLSRSIRVGTNYHCGGVPPSTSTPLDCPAGSSTFSFTSSPVDPTGQGEVVTYRLSEGQIERRVGDAGEFIGVTAPEVTVSELTFYAVGTSPLNAVDGGATDDDQAFVLVVIRGRAGQGKTETEFNLQTSISQRLLDI